MIPDVKASTQAVAVLTPVRSLGRIDGGSAARRVSWHLTPGGPQGRHRVVHGQGAISDAARHVVPVTLTFGDFKPGVVDANRRSAHSAGLVLGDSYSAGEGADPRSSRTSPRSVRRRSATDRRTSTRPDLRLGGRHRARLQRGEVGNIDVGTTRGAIAGRPTADLLADGYRPDVVFLSIGGNDAGFAIGGEELHATRTWRRSSSRSLVGVSDLRRGTRCSVRGPPGEQRSCTRRSASSSGRCAAISRTRICRRESVRAAGAAVPPIVVMPYPVIVPLSPSRAGQLCRRRTQDFLLSLKELDGIPELRAEPECDDRGVGGAARTQSHVPVYYAPTWRGRCNPGTPCAPPRPGEHHHRRRRDRRPPELLHPNVDGHRGWPSN